MRSRPWLGAVVALGLLVAAGCDAASDRAGGSPTGATTSTGDVVETTPTVMGWRVPEPGFCQQLLRGQEGQWWVGRESFYPHPDPTGVDCLMFEGDDERSAMTVRVVVGETARKTYDEWFTDYEEGTVIVWHPRISEVEGWERGQRQVSTGEWQAEVAQVVHREGIAIDVQLRHGRTDLLPGKRLDALLARLNAEAAGLVDAVVEGTTTTLGE